MHAAFLLLAVLPASGSSSPAGDTPARPSAFARAISQPEGPLVVRAQSPTAAAPGLPILGPIEGDVTTYYQPPTFAPSPGTVDPFNAPLQGGYPGPITTDPWLGGGMAAPYAAPAPGGPLGAYSFGINGPQPYRYGLNSRYDFSYLPSVGTSSPNVGDLGIFAFDLEKEWVSPFVNNWVFSIAPQYGLRLWDGPRGTPGSAHLPGDAHRFGLGLKLASPEIYGWTLELGFNPSYATDFEASASSDGVMYDAHAALFWRANPQFMAALGVAYWDRVDDIVLPYAGVVYTPNDYWEFRLLFPRPRISLFLGTPNGVPTWLYVSGEYHVEAFLIDRAPPGVTDQVQLTDWRVLGGLRFESGWLTSFVEAGWVFGRDVEFRSGGTNFDVDSGFITRVGFRY